MRTRILLIILGFNAVTAIIGGLLLMTHTYTPPLDWLTNTRFHSYLLPGLLLMIVVGGSALVAAIGETKHRQVADAIGLVSGVILCGWILNQIALSLHYTWLQLAYFVLGCVTIALTYTRTKLFLIEKSNQHSRRHTAS